jgi:hypothetical protein
MTSGEECAVLLAIVRQAKTYEDEMKKIMLVVITLALCAASFAGTPQGSATTSQQNADAAIAQAGAPPQAATSTCSFTFTSGSNVTALQFCVTANGNIAQLATPFAREHIAVGTVGEGYAICDVNASVGYEDYADFGDTGNWGPATVASQSATSVKIVRSTSDGNFTLTQTITQVASNQSVKIVMALKNNTSADRAIMLHRYADVDVSFSTNNNFDATATSAFGWNPALGVNPPFGLMIQNAANTVGLTPVPFVQNVGSGPVACVPGSHAIFGGITATDGSIVMSYNGTIPKKATRTVTMIYKGL